MATQVQFRGGSSTEHSSFTGAAREVTVDTTKDTLIVHDGSTAGGHPLAKENNPTFTGDLTISDKIIHSGDTNTFIRFPAADTFAVETAGSEALRIDSAGRVGIGTSSPAYNLEISPASGAAEVKIAGAEGQEASIRLYADQGDDAADLKKLVTDTSGNFKIQHYSGAAFVDSMVIDSSGRMLIGTTTAPGFAQADDFTVSRSTDAGITIRSGTAHSATLAFSDGTGGGASEYRGLIQYSHLSNSLAFSTNSAERLRIDSLGRLLVGTSSASSTATTLLLQGSPDGASGPSYLRLATGTSSPGSAATIGQISFTDSGHTTAASIVALRDGGTWTSGSSQPTRLAFSTTADGAASPTERMRIDNKGRIFTYNADTGNNSLTVSSAAGAGTAVANFIGTYSSTGINQGTNSFIVWTNGNVVNTNNSYGAISDLKLKENIVDASSQWDDIKALQVRKYNFKEGQTHTQIGLIAQEAELISPGLVSESTDRDADGNDLGTVTKGVNYSVLYMKAVKALQEAMERIETLEQRLTDAGL